MAQPRDKKRSDTAGISDVTGNFQLKSGSICRVFRKDLFVEPFVEKEWRWSGTRYARTANDWLDNFDCHRDEIERILRLVHGRNSSYGCGAGAGSFCDRRLVCLCGWKRIVA
jgi:cyclopropane fatty-acyl-phospholipid synthase-like methyltransferase